MTGLGGGFAIYGMLLLPSYHFHRRLLHSGTENSAQNRHAPCLAGNSTVPEGVTGCHYCIIISSPVHLVWFCCDPDTEDRDWDCGSWKNGTAPCPPKEYGNCPFHLLIACH